ncbi:porin [Methylobacterium sp. J-068]|uniref:porin n=1 Tax=Methylobacterium sp. J-068 TaxID=2836649 RepID=UPI001FB9995B|nr:porin [Methylobacterium sp. J-068]MCJ2032989.1 porin [Methylobacterium sp. J-068]
MPTYRSLLLGSVAALVTMPFARAADLPALKSAPIEYVRVCTTYGAGFFYIPGTDTCIRLSGRARAEFGYQQNFVRGNSQGDLSMYRGQMRLNVDARTQTDYGTLRAFVRMEASSRTGNFMWSGTLQRIGKAYAATGQDQLNRTQQQFDVDKAFIQFAGLTAGRASSFFDFYAHDFEIIGVSHGSDVSATNLLAYTATSGTGFSATVSMEDPTFRKTGIYAAAASAPALAAFGTTSAPSPVFQGFAADGTPTGVGFVDVVERNRMPDFVGTLRYDGTWGSAQISGAVKDVNTGNFIAGAYLGTNNGVALSAANAVAVSRPNTEIGWAVQGGVKINLPMIAAGDTLYLQGAYAQGGTQYTGVQFFTAGYITAARPFQGASFSQYLPDATLNPLTGKLQLVETFSAVVSYLHYWSPQWRTAVFASYAGINFAPGARAAQGAASVVGGMTIGGSPGLPNSVGYAFSEQLRDSHQYYAGGNLIWSPVRDLDIGVEGIYSSTNLNSGRVIDQNKSPGAVVASISPTGAPLTASGAVIRTTNATDTFQVRMRVQRDF